MRKLNVLTQILILLMFGFSTCTLESDYIDGISDKITSDNDTQEDPTIDDPTTEDPTSDDPLPAYGYDVELEITSAGAGNIALSWIEPDDSDYDHVEISWSPEGTSAVNINKGTTLHTLSGLNNGTVYTVTAKAVSVSGGKATGHSITMGLPTSSTIIYCLSTAAELAALMDNPTVTMECYYILTKNIDLSSYSSSGGWIPIGSETNPFTGTFNGNNHIISNLYINRSSNYQGLFGNVESSSGITSVIRNIIQENVQVSGNSYTGALVGNGTGIYINNCSAQGIVNGGDYTGGLVGKCTSNAAYGYIRSSNTSVNVTSTQTGTGGLVGLLTDSSSIYICSSTGSTSGVSMVGGLVGISQNSSSILMSYSTGAVYATNTNAGGLIGENLGSTVSKCYASGSVSADSDRVGGLIGLSSGPVSNCFATGNLTGTNEMGGLVGSNSNGIDRCFATGSVPGASNGGIVAIDTGMVNYCYYDTETTGQTETTGAPTSTAAMKTQSTFTNWDFSEIWSIDSTINNGYPYLIGMAP
ncbi:MULTISPECIES: GLUG motif-containing protein [unclassified Oceanispirochaeta]|uniref:GLUG motif-containing protein n=1 Tax=unclassified Oceanispirochaeta TaxID=2635722 RepID=UPI000E096176|nr:MULTISPECIES: GLUG motif-containing protein [unclassified Oceanispirochaeta]MBF9016430.1 fibronectin type III domain-containing protein [Oceanispirochaeta sp. M2]NPD72892.1 hypothetical protein [Oceanispirochaeta sp. M1]RDG31469.1 hypothetical protein DV872_12355 [Oceanispirochaeta sp. M1]